MQRQFFRCGFLLIGLFILILLAIGGWWFLRPAGRAAQAPPASPVQVFLLSPGSGDEASAGDYLSVTLQAFGPEAIVSAELFVDGKSLGVVSEAPESAWWSWQARDAGIHTLSARATDADGQVGQSQTVIITVLPGGGPGQVRAEEGQLLEQIGAAFGVPSDQMASANPHVNPAQPLAGGQPVQIPSTEGGTEDGPGSANGESGPAIDPAGGAVPKLINWQFQATEAVDKSYCYISFGNGDWEKMPGDPFEFFGGGQVHYPQYDFSLGENESIQIECWGWLAGTLKYLGKDEAQFEAGSLPDELMLTGSGFQLVGEPQFQQSSETGGSLTLAPPFALRQPSNKTECLQDHGIGALFVCESLEAYQYYVLVWEWEPPACWPGTCITEIDGYRLYELDQYAKTEKYLKQFEHPGQKAALVPVGWGTCFGVRAYVNDPAIEDSEMAVWCPGQELEVQQMTYQPSHMLTVGDPWVWYDDDCGGVAELWPVPGASEGMVGAIQVSMDDCGAQYQGSIGVKFPTPGLPQNAVLQKATLRYIMHDRSYQVYLGDDTWLASNVNSMCPANLGIAKQDWTGWGDHFTFAPPRLDIPSAMDPYMTLPEYAGSAIEITPLVSKWMKSPQTNLGLVIYPDWSRFNAFFTDDAVIQECFAFLSGLELDVFYFAP